jgi:hypothetical protein
VGVSRSLGQAHKLSDVATVAMRGSSSSSRTHSTGEGVAESWRGGGMPACQRAAGHSHQDRAPLCMHGPEHACSGQPGVASLQGGRLLLLNLRRGEQALRFVSLQLAELLPACVVHPACHRRPFCGRARQAGGPAAPFQLSACNLRSPQLAGYAANTRIPAI